MNEGLFSAEFESHRAHLKSVAYRLLGSASEADDAVQEAWLRLRRADPQELHNVRGWLTAVVSRICLDMLRTRRARPEEPLGERDPVGSGRPEDEAILAESVGAALLIVLETLAPAERLAFVLHDLFGVSFDEIAPIVGRSSVAARQLASRARRRVQGARATGEADHRQQRRIVDAFLAAARQGDFEGLLAILDPDAVVRADSFAAALGAAAEIRGARAVAESFRGRAAAARRAWVGGAPGAVWAPDGPPKVALRFTVVDGRVTSIDLLADPAILPGLAISILEE